MLLSIEPKNMNEIKETLNKSLLTNAKLAKAMEIFVGYHLTAREKESISKRIDACKDLEELEVTITLVNQELQKGFLDTNTGERWSPSFVNDIKSYYENGFPFNPIAKLNEGLAAIKELIVLQEILIKIEDQEKVEEAKLVMDEKRMACKQALQEMEDLLIEMGAGES
jgi:hypothetical protein